MRDSVEAFTESGGNVAFFSRNVCWIRFDLNMTRQICYKDARFDPFYPSQRHLVTVNWYDKPVFRAETRLTGVSYYETGRQASQYRVRRPDHWVFRPTRARSTIRTCWSGSRRSSGGLRSGWGSCCGRRPIARVAVLMIPAESELSFFGALQDAGRVLGVTPVSVTVDSPTQFDFAALTQAQPDALYVFPNSVNEAHIRAILDFAAAERLPAMYGHADWVGAGGLMSYNADWLAVRRRAAALVLKILKGTKPAEIPVEDPTTFSLVINLKTAKALGVTIPPSVLALADEIIQ